MGSLSSRTGTALIVVLVAATSGEPSHAASAAVAAAQSTGAGQSSRPGSASPEVVAELRRITQELLDAVAPGRVDVWQRYLDERVIYADENGDAKTKTELLADFRPLPAGLIGRIVVGTFQVEQYGDDLAVATREDRESLTYHGQQLESTWRTTDTWRKTADGWRLIAAQVLARPADPPETQLTQAQLCAYAGAYTLTASIQTDLTCQTGGLVSTRTGGKPATYRAELLDVFFVPGQPRTRRIFQRDSGGRVIGFVDRREGHDVRWKRRGMN